MRGCTTSVQWLSWIGVSVCEVIVAGITTTWRQCRSIGRCYLFLPMESWFISDCFGMVVSLAVWSEIVLHF